MKEEIRDGSPDEHVLNTLLYYDVFRYPLNSYEVFSFLQVPGVEPQEVDDALRRLATEGVIYRFGDFYTIQDDPTLIKRRVEGNQRASELMPVARRQASRIAKFPFVRAVMASGSLSKSYMDDESDLDFFVVTASGRLWIARTLLILYKRMFLQNSHKLFCVNYFVDENHLEIEEKNLFTATELATVIPLHNYSLYIKLIEQNAWLRNTLPNFTIRPAFEGKSIPNLFRGIFEKCINPIATPLDRWFMKLTLLRWERMYKNHYSPEQFRIAFKTKTYASKNHPRNYQKKVMDAYYKNLIEFNALNRVTDLQ
ncbi:MAG TPA: hypothetical protein VD927_00025 [Chryseosolibacter sp.]|nr:hypothetical protein [Chryseosolibacter sp.]